MPQNKNQHYVPQFYQRYFSDDEANTGVYILKAKKYLPNSAIKHQASADYFYSKDLIIEKGLSIAEGMVKEVFDALIANPRRRLNKKQQEAIYCNTILQMGRTLFQAKKQEAAITAMGKQLLEVVIQADKESGRGEYADIPQEAIDSTKIKLNEPGAFVTANFIKLLPLCRDLEYRVLINETNVPFVTSDNPVCMYNQFLERMGVNNGGLGQRGLQLYMPISPAVALFYYDPKVYKVGSMLMDFVRISKTDDVNELNKMLATQANEILIVQDSMAINVDFNVLGSMYDTYHNDGDAVGVNMGTDSNMTTVVGVLSARINCQCKMSFVKQRIPYAFMRGETFDADRYMYRETVKRERKVW